MHNHTLIKSSLAAALIAAAAAFPAAAQARHDEGPGGPASVSQVPVTRPQLVSQLGSVSSGTPAVRPNPDEQVATDATTSRSPGSEVIDNGGYGPAVARPAVARVATPGGGFDWGDAGIGAAATIGLLMLGVAGAFVLSQRHARRSGGSAALIS